MMGRKIFFAVLMLILLAAIFPFAGLEVEASEANLFLQTSLYTRHWRSRDTHNNEQDLLGIEYHTNNFRLYGLSHFQNSADQPCWYIYSGRTYDFYEFSNLGLYGKLTYGLITGYEEDDDHNAAWFSLGTFPAAIPMIGLEYHRLSVEAGFFADQGVIINAGINF